MRKLARRPTPCHGEWVALDVDVSPFDNSSTKKEGLSWTYKEVAGYAPMLSLGLMAYNVLRLCGQRALREQRRLPAEERAPLKKKVFRRRLWSVIQDLMYLAAQFLRHANRWRMVFHRNSPWGATWRCLYARFSGASIAWSG